MKNRYALLLSLVIGSVMVTPAWAGCPNDLKLKKIGTVQTASAVVSGSGFDVHAIALDCGGTACLVGIYDTDLLGTVSNANLTFEPGAAADTPQFINLTNSPLSFSEGVVVVDDGNVDSIALFTCRP